MSEKKISEEAKWFLNNIQKLQDDFAEAIGAQIVITDRDGGLLTKMSGQQRACQIIQKTKKGRENCTKCYKDTLASVRNLEKPNFLNCWSGIASLSVPIKTKDGRIVGGISGCGGRHDRGESREELREKFSKLADEIGITQEVHDREDFLKAAVDEIKVITIEEVRKRAERLAKLVAILAEETALKEAFILKGKEW